MYKNMLLNGVQKDNYKELSKKMIEAGGIGTMISAGNMLIALLHFYFTFLNVYLENKANSLNYCVNSDTITSVTL